MNFFKKIFGNVEVKVTENKGDIETNNPTNKKEQQEQLNITHKKDRSLSIEGGVEDSIYQFNGINNDFIDKLYFVNVEQKAKFLKYIEAIIDKFKFNEITSQSQFFKFEDNYLDELFEFEDNYKDKYPDYTAELRFPYFHYSNLISWKITDVIVSRLNGEVSTINKNIREAKEEPLNLNACEFNILNKSINNINDISVEENILMNYLESENYFKYYRISSIIKCLIKYYIKNEDFKKVDDLINLIINKVESDDKHYIEKDFEFISNTSVNAGNIKKGIEYLNRGIEFINTNFPIPKTKSMGILYKSLALILFESKEYEKALLIINNALMYNESLNLKQLKTKIEKHITK